MADLAAEDSEDVDAAGEGVGDGLEDEDEVPAPSISIRAPFFAGEDALDEQVEHRGRAEVLRRHAAGDREEARRA